MSADVYHKAMTTKKFDIPLDHLEYGYIESCKDVKELEKILKVLRSGDEGHYPDLEKFCENHLTKLNPSSRVLRKDTPVLTSGDLKKNDWNDIETDLKDWTNEMKNQDSMKQKVHGSSGDDNMPPVRGSNLIVNGTEETNGIHKVKKNEGKKKRVVPREYREWDQIDIDKELEKVDTNKPEKEPVKKGKKKGKPQNLEETIDSSGLSTAEKLSKANREKDKGNEAFKSQDFEEALVYYSRSISLLPTPASYNNRALAYLKVSKWDDAIRDCNNVLKMEQDNIKALLRRGTAYKGKNEFSKSEQDFKNVLKLEPENKRAEELLDELKKEINAKEKERKEKGKRMVIEEVDGSDAEEESNAKSTEKQSSKQPPTTKSPQKTSTQTATNSTQKQSTQKSSTQTTNDLPKKASTQSTSTKSKFTSDKEKFLEEHSIKPKKGKRIVIEESDSDDEDDLLECISIRPEALQPPIEDTEEVYSPSKNKNKKPLQEVLENFKKDFEEKAEEIVQKDYDDESGEEKVTANVTETQKTDIPSGSKTSSTSKTSTDSSTNNVNSEPKICNEKSTSCSKTESSKNSSSDSCMESSSKSSSSDFGKESSKNSSSDLCKDSDSKSQNLQTKDSDKSVSDESINKSPSSDSISSTTSEHMFSRPVFKQLEMPTDVSVLREAGNNLFRKGQYGEAVEKYKAAIKSLEKVEEEQKVNLSIIYSNKAQCELKIGDLPSVIKDCKKALELVPHSVKPLLRRAAAYEGIERYPASYADYKHVLCIDNSIEAAIHGLSRTQQALQQVHGSKWRDKLPPIPKVMPWEVPEIVDVTKPSEQIAKPSESTTAPASSSQPNSVTSSTDISKTKGSAEQNAGKPRSSPEREKVTPPKETTMSPTEKFEDLKSKGNTCVQKGEFRKAIEYYTECIELKPGKTVGYTNRALCFLRVDEPGLALVDCEAALLKEPDNVKALFRRAQAKKMLKKYKESVEDLTHLLKIDAKNAAAKKELEIVKNYWREELNAMKGEKSKEPEKKPEPKAQKTEPKQRKKIIVEEEDDDRQDNTAHGQSQEEKSDKKSKHKSKHGSQSANTASATPKSQQQDSRATPPKSQQSHNTKTTEKTQGQESRVSPPKSQETKKSKKSKSKQTKETSPGLPNTTPTVPKLEKVSPYEFIQAWNSLKLANEIEPYVKLVEQIPSEELPNMITNKLDGAMLNKIVQCTEKMIEQGKSEKSHSILKNLCKVERFKTISMFMSGSDKDDVEEVLEKLAKNISSEDLSSLKKEFGIK